MLVDIRLANLNVDPTLVGITGNNQDVKNNIIMALDVHTGDE